MSPKSQRSTFTPARRLSSDMSEPADEFAADVGKVIWAWNYSHAAFSRLFATIISPKNLMIGFNMWHTLQSDTAQRELLIAAASAALRDRKPLLRRIEWAKQAADKLATHRNDLTHLATAWSAQSPVRQILTDPVSTAPKRVRRLSEQQDLRAHAKRLRGDLIALAIYVNTFSVEVILPGHWPLPRRPKMQSIPALNPSSKKARRKPRSKRPRPPASSPS